MTTNNTSDSFCKSKQKNGFNILYFFPLDFQILTIEFELYLTQINTLNNWKT